MRTSLVAALVALAVGADTAAAQEVTGLDVRQGDGFATLAWTPVAGATDYQIERTPVDADDTATGPSGDHRPVAAQPAGHQETPTFADAGFNPGDRFRWRVRARIGTRGSRSRQPCSRPRRRRGVTRPCRARTCARSGNRPRRPSSPATPSEYAYTAAIDAASDRVRVVEIGRTVLGPADQHVRHRLPDAAAQRARRRRRDVPAGHQLQRARQRARQPGELPDPGARAGFRQRPPDDRPAAHTTVLHRPDRSTATAARPTPAATPPARTSTATTR